METLYEILGLLAAGVIAFILYRYIKSSPQVLSKESLSKSFYSMGMLGLILIVFVAFLVLVVRST